MENLVEKKSKTPITANIFRILRCRYKYKQKTVAEWLGLDRTTYSRKENGIINIYADELIILIEELSRAGHHIDGALNLIDVLNSD